MNKGDLINNVAKAAEVTKVQAAAAVDSVLESIEKNTFWSKQLGNYDHYMEKMLSKLASW